MHLPELPTIFVKNGEERKVYFTVQARELSEMGWVEKGKEKVQLKKAVKEAAPKAAKEVSPATPAPKERNPVFSAKQRKE